MFGLIHKSKGKRRKVLKEKDDKDEGGDKDEDEEMEGDEAKDIEEEEVDGEYELNGFSELKVFLIKAQQQFYINSSKTVISSNMISSPK